MRITILQPRVSYYLGGGEKYCLDAVKALLESGVNITLVTTETTLGFSDMFIEFENNYASEVKIIKIDMSHIQLPNRTISIIPQ